MRLKKHAAEKKKKKDANVDPRLRIQTDTENNFFFGVIILKITETGSSG